MREKYSDTIAVSGARLKTFTRKGLKRIHDGALYILEKTGLKVEFEDAAEIFHDGGAFVEKKEGIFQVKLPQYLVEECLSWVPRHVIYYGRDKKFDYVAEPESIGFMAFGQCVNVLDPYTGKLRPAGKVDMAKSARIQDALENLRIVARTLSPGDQYSPSQALHCIDAIIRNTGKHISGGAGNVRNFEMIIQLMEVAAGGSEKFRKRPFYSPSFCPVSPLTLGKECCEVAIGAAKAGLSVVVMIMPLAGGTAPVTLPGTVVLGIAEQLSGLVLVQLVRKGTPVTMGSATTIMDLKTGLGAMGAPESGIINAALAQMARYYQVPSRVACGVSDSKLLDAQVGYEYATNALTAALSGATLVFGGGALESGLTHSPAKLVMDHECMGNIRRIVEGVIVDDENLALDIITEVGPDQSYLTHEHTFERMRTQSKAEIFNRKSRDTWLEADNGKTAAEVATKKAKEIIESHQPSPLPHGAEQTMNEMVAEFESQLRAEEYGL